MLELSKKNGLYYCTHTAITVDANPIRTGCPVAAVNALAHQEQDEDDDHKAGVFAHVFDHDL